MDYLVHPLLDQSTTKSLVQKLLSNGSPWQDGKTTAGSHAAKVKNNYQLDRNSKLALESSKDIIQQITNDQLIKSFALPKLIHGIMFTRTTEGQGYGMHIDNAYMSTGRSDLSFTLFLSDPQSYEGGELDIQNMQNNKEIKLSSGHIFIYPSTSLHAVKKVTKGERLVCVGWIQSHISSNEDRNTLFGLDAGSKALLARYGRSPELDLIFQSYSNLLRRLGD